MLKMPLIGSAGSVTFYNGWTSILIVPQWAVLGASTVLAVVPWMYTLSYRFSLRTLLIATTLVAVGLGLIVWLR